jgi:hypothetical protein
MIYLHELTLRPPIRLRSVLSLMPPRYEIQDLPTRYRNGSFEKEPMCKPMLKSSIVLICIFYVAR